MTAGVEGPERTGWERLEDDECHCGKAGRGWVGPEGGVPPHRCRQCSAEHCEHASIARRCEFGICVREAELELTVDEAIAPVRVCGLHVSPVINWGVADPAETRIRPLTSHERGAAA